MASTFTKTTENGGISIAQSSRFVKVSVFSRVLAFFGGSLASFLLCREWTAKVFSRSNLPSYLSQAVAMEYDFFGCSGCVCAKSFLSKSDRSDRCSMGRVKQERNANFSICGDNNMTPSARCTGRRCGKAAHRTPCSGFLPFQHIVGSLGEREQLRRGCCRRCFG